jgi:hypothetical protein
MDRDRDSGRDRDRGKSKGIGRGQGGEDAFGCILSSPPLYAQYGRTGMCPVPSLQEKYHI